MYINFEIFLANFSFLTLFISMLIYWIQASNFEFRNEEKPYPLKDLVGTRQREVKTIGGIAKDIQKTILNSNIFGSVGMLISNLCLFMLLALRWYESGHFPLSNLYESLMFLSWSLTLIHLFVLKSDSFQKISKSAVLNSLQDHPFGAKAPRGKSPLRGERLSVKSSSISESKSETAFQNLKKKKESGYETSDFVRLEISGDFDSLSPRIPGGRIRKGDSPNLREDFARLLKDFAKGASRIGAISKKKKNLFINKLIGSITAPCALFTNAFATFSLPKEMQESSSLVPALQSNWLMMHVTVMILSYAALILGSLLSIGFLVISNTFERDSKSDVLKSLQDQPFGAKAPRRFGCDSVKSDVLQDHPFGKLASILAPPRREGETSDFALKGTFEIFPSLPNSSAFHSQILAVPKHEKRHPDVAISKNLVKIQPDLNLQGNNLPCESLLYSFKNSSASKTSFLTNSYIDSNILTFNKSNVRCCPEKLSNWILNHSKSSGRIWLESESIGKPQEAAISKIQLLNIKSAQNQYNEILSQVSPIKFNPTVRKESKSSAHPEDLQNNSEGFSPFVNMQGQLSLNKNSQEQDQKNRYNLAKILDNLSYRILGLGFPLLTIGILSGAVWANEAWGSYWSWDPKETWALLTWLVFAIYLHTRLTKGWEGKKPALIASLGFVTVWICFLGVNLIGEGLHSYGWLS